VQIGSASELFEKPRHTFVGHFIGSPGMNFLPVSAASDGLRVAGHRLALPGAQRLADGAAPLTLGVRPEYVTLAESNAPEALPVRVTQAQDIGMYWLVTGSVGSGADERVVRARVSPQQAIPRVGDTAWFGVVGAHTCFYRGDELITEAAP